MNTSTQVIYIMSDKRSGSTLLENILSKSGEAVSVGELAMLKGHLIKEGFGERWNWNCSCGKPFLECTFWSPILKDLYTPNQQSFDTKIAWNFKTKLLAINAIIPTFFTKKIQKIIQSKKNKRVTDTLANLYTSIAGHSGKKFIIDSSKLPVQALAVYKKAYKGNVKVIWLKRDIRAIATSKRKWKEQNQRKRKTLLKQIFDIFYYKRLCYTVAKMIDPADLIEMDYESLAQHTKEEMQRLISAIGMKPFTIPEYMELEEDHTIAGTPGRFSKKPIQYDDAWKKQFESDKLAYATGGLLNKL